MGDNITKYMGGDITKCTDDDITKCMGDNITKFMGELALMCMIFETACFSPFSSNFKLFHYSKFKGLWGETERPTPIKCKWLVQERNDRL